MWSVLGTILIACLRRCHNDGQRIFGYSRVAHSAGQPLRALAVDIARILSGPLIALAIGTRAPFQFQAKEVVK